MKNMEKRFYPSSTQRLARYADPGSCGGMLGRVEKAPDRAAVTIVKTFNQVAAHFMLAAVAGVAGKMPL